MRRHRLFVIAALGLICVFCGCTESSPSSAETSTTATGSGPATAIWSRNDLALASAASRVGDLAVLYTLTGEDLFLTALDAQTGATVWSRPATVSGVLAGLALRVDVLDERWVAYYAPVAERAREAQLVLLDPAQGGTELARSDTKVFYSYPGECVGDPASACARAMVNLDEAATFKLSPGGPAVRQPGGGARRESIGSDGLVRFYEGSQTHVGVEKDGALVWSHPEVQLFGARYSTNGGWWFRHSEATRTFVGTVGLSREAAEANQVAMASKNVTIALDAATGVVRWAREGIDTFCDIEITVEEGVDVDPLLACQWLGGQLSIDRTAGSVTYVKPVMALTALDIASGQSRWTAQIGEVAQGAHEAMPAPALVPDAVVVERVAGAVRIALADGAESAPDPTVVAWRRALVDFPQKVAWSVGTGSPTFTRYAWVEEGFQNGQVTDTVTLPLPATVGARFDGGLAVLTTAKGVAAYRT